MALKLDKRLYHVRVKDNCYVSGIEASSAEEACEIARKDFKTKSTVDCTSEPIFKAGIGLEVNDAQASENGIFEITIKGTDEKLIEAFKKALGYLIPGPHHADEEEWEEELCGTTVPLKNFMKQHDIYVTSF